MKTSKKIIAFAACCVMIAAAAVFATLAYLWSQDTVTNTFTVGDVAITLDEAKVDEYGNPVGDLDGDGKQDRAQSNVYHLVPGRTYTKDPTVTVSEESENAFVRILVTVNCISELDRLAGGDGKFEPQNYVDGWDSSKWLLVKTTDNGDDTKTYEFRYYTTVGGGELEPLFEHLVVPDDLDGSDLAGLGDLKIQVVAHAIQAAGFDSTDKAWEEFEKQMEAAD